MAEYMVDFWMLAVDAGWNEMALQGVFTRGINEQVKDELATCDEPADLSAIRLDNRLRERELKRAACTPTQFSPRPS